MPTTLTDAPQVAPSVSPPQELDTLADVLARLGGISTGRVIAHPYPATEEDALRFVNGEPKRLVELVDCRLVEKAMGNRESLLAGWIITCLNNFIVPRRLGIVGAPDALMRFSNGLNRMPDVYFKAWATLPSPDAHRRPVADYAPDLAVDVLSEHNTVAEIARKRREYFAAGVPLVWIVDPGTLTVSVYTMPDACEVLSAGDTLTGDPVLTGFRLSLAELFGYLDPP